MDDLSVSPIHDMLYRLAVRGIDSKQEQELLRQARLHGLDGNMFYMVILVQHAKPGEAWNYIDTWQMLCNRVPLFGSGIVFPENRSRLFILIPFHHIPKDVLDRADKLVSDTCQAMLHHCSDKQSPPLYISIGNLVPALSQLQLSYQAARNLLDSYCFTQPPNVVFTQQDVFRTKMPREGPLRWNEHLKRLRNMLDMGYFTQAEYLIELLNIQAVEDRATTAVYLFYFRKAIQVVVKYLYSKPTAPYDYIEELNDTFATVEQKFSHSKLASDWLIGIIRRLGEGKTTPSKVNQYVQQALDIIGDEYGFDLSLQELAARLDISFSYLSRIFKEEVGMSFKEYLTRYKLGQAKELLSATDWPIERVASEVGYNYYMQFARMFRKFEGISAMEYRTMTSSEWRIRKSAADECKKSDIR